MSSLGFIYLSHSRRVLYFCIFAVTSLSFHANAQTQRREIDIQDTRVLQNPPDIRVKGSVLYYDGPIITGSGTQFIELIKNNPVSKVSMNSLGGDVVEALNIADVIYEKKLDVEVRTICASACANYIFPAGANKYLNQHSFLLWHGGANGPIREMKMENGAGEITAEQFSQLPFFTEIKKRELLFYKKIGVNYKVSFCPQLQSNYHDKFPEKWFSYSAGDLDKFGLTNIHYSGTPSSWYQGMEKENVVFANYCE